jgi:hypothetical protein
MREAITIILALATGYLIWHVRTLDLAFTEQRRQIQELNTKFAARPKSNTLEIQAKCATQGSTFWKENGWDKREASYLTHFNQKLDKCFIFITYNPPSKGLSVIQQLQDAFEGKGYGEYSWSVPPGKAPAEVKPILCSVISPAGQKTICNSPEEFDALVKMYME